MKRYLLSIYQPDGDPLPPAFLEPIMRDVSKVAAEMRAAGAWVFSAGLHPPYTATVVKVRGGQASMTDGPYVEGKEHIGGFTLIPGPRSRCRAGMGKKACPGGHAAGRRPAGDR